MLSCYQQSSGLSRTTRSNKRDCFALDEHPTLCEVQSQCPIPVSDTIFDPERLAFWPSPSQGSGISPKSKIAPRPSLPHHRDPHVVEVEVAGFRTGGLVGGDLDGERGAGGDALGQSGKCQALESLSMRTTVSRSAKSGATSCSVG